jgi:hypothetical protein
VSGAKQDDSCMLSVAGSLLCVCASAGVRGRAGPSATRERFSARPAAAHPQVGAPSLQCRFVLLLMPPDYC